MQPSNSSRVSVTAEIRAWVGVGVVLAVNVVGGAWWAATLSAELKHLRDVVTELKLKLADRYSGTEAARDLAITQQQLRDHEQRLRLLERGRPER